MWHIDPTWISFLFQLLPPPLPAPHLGPADMTGQLLSVQNSVMVPYNMLIWLKKSTAAEKGLGVSQM